MSEELKQILQGALFRELEQYFIKEADKIKHQPINRSKSLQDQGLESWVNELAGEGILGAIKNIKQDLGMGNETKKISYK